MAKREGKGSLETGDQSSTDQVLTNVLQELETLYENLKGHLSADIDRLQQEKSRLIDDVERLREQSQQIQSKQLEYISKQSLSQQQLWLKQLAQVLAYNLQEQLVQQLRQASINTQASVGPIPGSDLPLVSPASDRQSNELLASLQASLKRTFQTVQQDLSNYQSDLSQQINSMQNLERQGEAILETLVARLRHSMTTTVEAQSDWDRDQENRGDEPDQDWENASGGSSSIPGSHKIGILPPPIVSPPDLENDDRGKSESDQDETTNDWQRPAQPFVPSEPDVADTHSSDQDELPAAPPPAPPAPKGPSQVPLGLVMGFASAIVLSLFNVCLKVLIKSKGPRLILGLFSVDGVVTPGFGNSLLILLFRMIVVMLLMPILATFLYPSVWSDLRRFFEFGGPGLWTKVIGSGAFLFMSQVLIYVAIGNIPTGIAITIFFIYPIITVLGAWFLFKDKPTLLRFIAIGGIAAGLITAAIPSFSAKIIGDVPLGIMAGIGSGITFAGYVLCTQMAAGKLHPIPFSLVNFAIIFILSSLSLWVPWPAGLAPNIDPDVWGGLIFGGIILGVFTLFSYLLNNFAIRFAGGPLASAIGTLGPALTALFAFLLINEKVGFIQIIGMAIVTISVAIMSWEKIVAAKQKK